MPHVTTKIEDTILETFRDTIYTNSGLKRGDFRSAVEAAMKDYIEKNREY